MIWPVKMASRPASAGGTPKNTIREYENYDLGDAASSELVQKEQQPATASAPAPSRRPGDNTNIDIFVRIRPVAKASQRLAYDPGENKLEFNIPRDVGAGYVNNQREAYEFRFNGIVGPDAKQDEVGP